MQHPVGAGVFVETAFVWCASPILSGCTCWGAPDAKQARQVLRPFEAFLHPEVGPRMDVLLDGYRIDTVEPTAALVLFEWARLHLSDLKQRIGRQVGVPPPSFGALILAGIMPVLGDSYPQRILATPNEAYRYLLGDAGEALCDEIAAQIAAASETSVLAGALRALLRSCRGNLTLGEAARVLHISSRSLQRELVAGATSFRAEQSQARMTAAQELLLSSDEKLAVVASYLGLSEQGLNRLVRERLGITSEIWRRHLRNR